MVKKDSMRKYMRLHEPGKHGVHITDFKATNKIALEEKKGTVHTMCGRLFFMRIVDNYWEFIHKYADCRACLDESERRRVNEKIL